MEFVEEFLKCKHWRKDYLPKMKEQLKLLEEELLDFNKEEVRQRFKNILIRFSSSKHCYNSPELQGYYEDSQELKD